MPTPGERLATIEAALREVRDDVKHLRDTIEGGNGIEWKRSVRGQLHEMRNAVRDLTLRRSYGVGLLKGWVQLVLLLCGVATATAAWYAAVHR